MAGWLLTRGSVARRTHGSSARRRDHRRRTQRPRSLGLHRALPRGLLAAVVMTGAGARRLQPAASAELYVGHDAWLREREQVLYRSWFCVGRVDELGLDRPNRLAVVDVAGESLLLTTDSGGALHAAYNVCR